MTKATTFELTYLLYASPPKVFEALTQPALIEKWGGGKAIVEPFENGKFEMFEGWVKGNVMRFEPCSMLSYSWKPAEWKPKDKASTVEFKLKEHQVGTELTIIHSGFPGQDEADKHREGWINFVLEPLNDFLIA